MTLNVRKKDGTVEKWNDEKIIEASVKASNRVNKKLTPKQKEDLLTAVYELIPPDMSVISTSDIHTLVIYALTSVDKEAGKSYKEFRDYKDTYAKEFEKIKELADDVLLLGDNENANFDSSLVSTKGSLIKGYLTKSLYTQFYLSKEEKELTKRGDIYIHDLRDMLLNSFNCCLFDMATVLKGGFEMSNVKYTEPTSVLSALQVIGDITLVATAQQFGGFTIAEIDKVLLPYCIATFNRAFKEAVSRFGFDSGKAYSYAFEVLERELEQGFQSLELKLNTVPCSRGDFAFTTITFGTWDTSVTPTESQIMSLIGEVILNTRMKGHGGKQVVFPKLVFLYDENNIDKDYDQSELFKKAVECSSKCMYPDFLSLTGNIEHNVVAQVYKESKGKAITSPMGCRAYLSPWKDPETNEYVTIGRCNIGAVSLNIPLIMAVTKEAWGESWKEHFWDELGDRLEVIRGFLKKRYDAIRNVKASTNPMAFMQGGLYKGYLKDNECVGDLVKYMTASFGITALNEASILWYGKTLVQDNSFAKKVVNFIQDKVNHFKKEDGYLYALYGTPAESLCGTQASQYAKYTGDTQFGSYFSNSFHCHVNEDITPFEKQDLEEDLFHMVNGGHIQYVRLDNPENLQANMAIIKRGMDKGFYQGVNFDSAYCNDCGKHSTNVMWKCPHCGSSNLTVISRVCGYLGYSNVNGKSRMNESKMSEIKDRVSM